MRGMEFHDNFQPSECAAGQTHPKEGISAVTLEAGLTWMDVYAAATDRNLVRTISILFGPFSTPFV